MNIIHSIDAYVLRCMERRCNYDYSRVNGALHLVKEELARRENGEVIPSVPSAIDTYVDLYNRTNVVDAVIFPWINSHSVGRLETDHLEALVTLAESMLVHKPFELVTVHDEFKCHPNYCNDMRQHYIDIFAELADSNVLDDIVHQITGSHVSYTNAHIGLSDMIRTSEYALS